MGGEAYLPNKFFKMIYSFFYLPIIFFTYNMIFLLAIFYLYRYTSHSIYLLTKRIKLLAKIIKKNLPKI